MKNEFAIFAGDQRVSGTYPESEEVEFVQWFVLQFFTRDEEGGAWLLYDPANGDPLALAAGPFRPIPALTDELRARGLPGIAEVPIRFAPLLQAEGLNAIKWDGHAVVAVGH
jgi:hypothetical protein